MNQLETIGISGGIRRFCNYTEEDSYLGLFSLAINDKIYFKNFTWDREDYGFLVFNQKLRKWTREMQFSTEDKYVGYCISNNVNVVSENPTLCALTNKGYIYNIAFKSNFTEEGNYIKENLSQQGYDLDVYTAEDGKPKIYNRPIEFYLKTKEFKNGTLSKQKSLTQLWINYDFIDFKNSDETYIDIKITTNDRRIKEYKNALPKGNNLTKCILIPNDMQNADSYTFEIYGKGFIRIYGIERIDRTDIR